MSTDLGKVKKTLSTTFLNDYDHINEDDAAHMIVKAEQQIKTLQDEMKSDEELLAAIQVKQDLESVYKKAIKYEKAKVQFLLSKIEEIQEGQVNPESSLSGD